MTDLGLVGRPETQGPSLGFDPQILGPERDGVALFLQIAHHPFAVGLLGRDPFLQPVDNQVEPDGEEEHRENSWNQPEPEVRARDFFGGAGGLPGS